MQTKKVKTSSLIVGIIVLLAFAVFMGFTTGPSFGSHYPQLNLVAKPFVCPDGQMSYTNQEVQRYDETYWNATWYCEQEQSNVKTELDPQTVFRHASPLYIFLYFFLFLLITYLYWNSSIGPAQNNGPRLW
jgi:hypothetical protein